MKATAILIAILTGLACYPQRHESKLANADTAYIQADYETALNLYLELVDKFQKINDKKSEILAQFGLIKTNSKLYKFDTAKVIIQALSPKVLELEDENLLFELTFLHGVLKSQIGEEHAIDLLDSAIAGASTDHKKIQYLVQKGLHLVNSHQLISADSIYKTAQIQFEETGIVDPFLQARLIDLGGRVKWHTGDFSSALILFQKELKLIQGIYENDHPVIAGLYGSIGIMYKNLLQYDKALEYYGLALDIRKRRLGENHMEVSNSYNNIGYLLYKKEQFDKALEIHNKALNIRQKLLDPHHLKILQSIEHIGLCYGGMEKYDEAEKYFRKILEIRTKKYGYNHHLTGYALYNLGAVADEVPDFKKAASYFEEAIEIGKVVYGPHNYDQADNYNRLGNCYLELGQISDAINCFQLGMQSNLPGHIWNKDPEELAEVDHYLSFREIQRSLLGLAQAHSVGKKSITSMQSSISYLQAAEKLIRDFKKSFTNQGDLITISLSSKILADYGVEIFGRLYEIEPKEDYLNEVFRYTELAKSSSLLSKLTDEKAKNLASIPDSLLIMDANFRNQKDSLNNKILALLSEKKDTKQTKEVLFKTNREHEKFITNLEVEYPLYAKLKFGLQPKSIQEIKNHLEKSVRERALIDYFLTDDNQLYSVFISSEISRLAKVNAESIAELITKFRKEIENQGVSGLNDYSAKIYDLLISPHQAYLKKQDLVIIPDGILGYIPFGLLQNDGKYLIENHIISYDLSATLLATRENKKFIKPKVLAYAPIFENRENDYSDSDLVVRSQGLAALPGANREVNLLNSILNCTIRIGMEASEKNFKDEASGYSIIHLATHSVINKTDPDYSTLIFSNDDEQDGLLHAFELSNLSLNAELVTLSACNTGIGKIEEGEGVMSMARTFSAAGVPSVVMSLWPASDKSTPELMKYFYQNLKNGQTKDVALNNARKSYLATAQGKARHPFYWGGFVLIGDNSPIEDDRNLLVYLLPSVLVIVMILTVYRRRKSRG